MSEERAPPGAKGASRWDPTGRDLAATQKQCSRGRKQLTGAECDELSALFAGAEMDLFGDKKGGLDPAIADCVIKQLRDKLWVSHCENEKLKEEKYSLYAKWAERGEEIAELTEGNEFLKKKVKRLLTEESYFETEALELGKEDEHMKVYEERVGRMLLRRRGGTHSWTQEEETAELKRIMAENPSPLD